MKRREFIKGSAIVGAGIVVPDLLKNDSGMHAPASERKVFQIIQTQKTLVGTLPVMRAFAGDQTDYVSPFVFFDEFGPVELTPHDKPLRVDAHPHAGIVPTTYFLDGSGHHKDSLNYDFQIAKGDFMMFSSGRGAIHMEETGQKLYDNGGIYHGFQIWLNMPAKYKFTEPSTHVYRTKDVGFAETKAYSVNVLLGELFGAKSSIEMLSPAFYYHIKLKADNKIEIPTEQSHNVFVYLINGDLELEGQRLLKPNQVALYERGDTMLNLYSKTGAEMLVLGGQPLNEMVYAYGPFVMNTEDEIKKCIADYNSGKMGNPAVVNGR